MEDDLLGRIARNGLGAWGAFLEAYASTIFQVVCLFADSYDERMDLFLHACDRLRADDMRRIRAFRRRPDAPCRLSTFLSVVVKNVSLDYLRARDGRFRPFRVVDAMDEIDRLIFEYNIRQGRSLEESRSALSGSHGIDLDEPEMERRASRVAASLSASQRWRLLSRLGERRGALPLDTVNEHAGSPGRSAPLASTATDPERPLREEAARNALMLAFRSMEPRQHLAVTLRYRDGLPLRRVAEFMRVSPEEARRLASGGLERVREIIRSHGIDPPDIELNSLALPWARAGDALT